jgi:site-specific DNA-cytosine methylase
VPVCELCGSASRTSSASGSSRSTGPVSRAIPTCAPLWPTPTRAQDATAVSRRQRLRLARRRQRGRVTLTRRGSEMAEGVVPVPVPYVDVLCGGFPCQDLSYAGKGAGLDGERSGLWGEYARLIRELRPRYVVVENVSALLARGLGRVLGDLAACGYDAEWDCIPASAVGAPHRRDRVWLVAYPNADAMRDRCGSTERLTSPPPGLREAGARSWWSASTCHPLMDAEDGTQADEEAEGLHGLRRDVHELQPLAGQDLLAAMSERSWPPSGHEAMGWWDVEPPSDESPTASPLASTDLGASATRSSRRSRSAIGVF